ncbi:SAP domain-containing protein [Salinicoccus albus]|uniref:SAP domain-containing protein n=1 Tax=Salinicoccus albus TaxID=418756 RepID=UPI00036D1332|nr:SAP domain-containing protein [Salinicoccus albus]
MGLNAVEVLYLHFVHGRIHEEATQYNFWLTQYSVKAADLIRSLLDKGVIFENNDLSVTLWKLKVPELKTLLRHSGMKVSGTKGKLVERAIENRHLIDLNLADLKPVYTVKSDYDAFLKDTEFINYFHFNGHISIYEAYEYYLTHPDRTSNEVAAGILAADAEESLRTPNKYRAIKSFQLLSHFYLQQLNDLNSSIYYLNNFTMLIILQSMTNYHKYKSIMPGSHFNIDNFTAEKYRVLLKTNQMTPYGLNQSLVDDTENLPYSYEQRKMAAKFIVDYIMEDNEAESKLRRLLDE